MNRLVFWAGLALALLLGGTENSRFSLLPTKASACDYCLLTQGLSPLETTHGFGFRVDGRYTRLNSVFSGSSEVENHDNEKETHFTTQFTGFYNASDRLTLIAIMPIPRRSVSLTLENEPGHDDGEAGDGHADEHTDELVHGHSAPGTAFSAGDLNLLGRYTFFSKHNYQQSTLLAVQGGVKIPTGATDKLDDTGEFLDAHIQPGTGSWNFLAGLTFNYVKNRFGLTSSLLYSINTTGESGDDDYRFGNWLNAEVTAKYPIVSGKRNLFLSLGLNGEFRGKEEINNVTLSNTGGEVLYLAPGLQFMFSRRFVLEASVFYPFYHNLDGSEQLGEDFKSFFGINYVLN